MLGLGSNISKAPSSGATIVTDNLVLRHGYAVNPVQPLSDGAAYFSGDGSDINIPTITLNDATAWTIAYWAYCNANNDMTIGEADDTDNRFYHQPITDNRVRIHTDSVNGNLTHSAGLVSLNQWNHYAITCDGSNTLKLYINGIYQSTAEFADTKFVIDNIGNPYTETGYALDGYMCNVGVWSATLDQAQIKSIMWKKYSQLTSSETTSLVSWWNLSKDANDNHGSNNGTLT